MSKSAKFFKITLLSLFTAPLPLISYSQTLTTGLAGQENLRSVTGAGNNTILGFDQRYSGVKGNPFFTASWLPGILELKVPAKKDSTKVYKDLQLKYDAFRNEIIAVPAARKDTLAFNALQVASFQLNFPELSSPLTFKTYPEAKQINSDLQNAFFAVLHDGKTDFVKRVNKDFVKANFQGGYSAGQTSDQIVDELQYYIVANGKMQKVKLNKKSVLETFPAQEVKLKAYISSQKLAMNKEEDIVKVLAYLDTL